MRIDRKLSSTGDQEAPRHPEVNQENETGIESYNQILAASFDCGDPLAFQLRLDDTGVDRACQPLVEDTNGPERPAGEDSRQLAADRLDLGQLRHVT